MYYFIFIFGFAAIACAVVVCVIYYGTQYTQIKQQCIDWSGIPPIDASLKTNLNTTEGEKYLVCMMQNEYNEAPKPPPKEPEPFFKAKIPEGFEDLS